MPRISLLVGVFVMVTLMMTPFTSADYNLVDDRYHVIPEDLVMEAASIWGDCGNDTSGDCDDIMLIIEASRLTNSEYTVGKHNISMRRTFTLGLRKESCRFYQSNNVTSQFAILTVCQDGQTRDKVYTGTFFDAVMARYDFGPRAAMAGDSFKIHDITRANWHARPAGERSLVTDVHPQTSHLDQEYTVPDLGKLSQPAIELLIGIDDSLFQYFHEDKEETLKHVAGVVNVADALWSMHGIRIKWVGVRFWKELGFNEERPQFLHKILVQYQRLTHGFSHLAGEEEPDTYNGRMSVFAKKGSPDHIPGTPDSMMTLMHEFMRFDPEIYGRAEMGYNKKFAAQGIVQDIHASPLTMHEMGSRKLHYYTTGALLAHEIGHNMFLHHSTEQECYPREGTCIMTYLPWPIPLWTRAHQAFIQESLRNGTYQFMWRQNVHHADLGTVHKTERMSKLIRFFTWFLVIALIIADLWIVILLGVWLSLTH